MLGHFSECTSTFRNSFSLSRMSLARQNVTFSHRTLLVPMCMTERNHYGQHPTWAPLENLRILICVLKTLQMLRAGPENAPACTCNRPKSWRTNLPRHLWRDKWTALSGTLLGPWTNTRPLPSKQDTTGIFVRTFT